MKEVNRNALVGMLRLVLLLATIIFVPAWTLQYWQAWLCLLVFFASVAVITVYLMQANPALLERRMKAGAQAETEKSQKVIQAMAAVVFVAIFVVPALDHRLHWSTMSVGFEILGDALILIGFAFVLWVFKANSFTSGIIEVAAGQKVITSGPYALVRHPMYLGSLITLAGIPLSLGSWWGLILIGVMTGAIVLRLLDEEKFLARNLKGYEEYLKRVGYRLAPFVW
jgi:protein-S-isoprenylcysteine O-methyltransferase Ste14